MMDLNKVVTNVERAVRNLAVALKGILDRSFNSHRYRRRVSYNGRYWKITEDNSINIKLLCMDMGSNEKAYYNMVK